MKKKGNLAVSAKLERWSLSASGSKTDADGYKVKNESKLNNIIIKTNQQQERTGTPFEIKNLGYEDQSHQIKLGYRLIEDLEFKYALSRYEAEDISFTHGGIDSSVFVYDIYNRDNNRFSIQSQKMGKLFNPSLQFQSSTIERGVENNSGINLTVLDTQGLLWKNSFSVKDHLLSFGMEWTQDEAETAVYAEQDYLASYINVERVLNRWSFSTGIRVNHWTSAHELKPGQRADVASQLVGLAGKIEDRPDELKPTYALGLVYFMNDRQNFSFNYSRTHRHPTLYERFAFDTFQGDPNLLSERAHNLEASWKYRKRNSFASIHVFYSDFSSYTGTKNVVTIDQTALSRLVEAVRAGQIPESDLEDRMSEYSDFNVKFTSFENVQNSGFETVWEHIHKKNLELGVSFGLNHFSSDSVFLSSNDHPFEIKAKVKRTFPKYKGQPWLQLKSRYVTDRPKVKQTEGFSAFVVADLLFGLKGKRWLLSGGVRNLGDTVYHEPYLALDGLKRTFFLTFKWELEKKIK